MNLHDTLKQFPTALLLFFLITAPSGAAEKQALSRHLPPAALSQPALARLAVSNHLHLAIGLPLRNCDALTNLLRDLYDPASPSFRHFLTPEQFTERFGPTPEDYAALHAFARANGLKVAATHPNRMLLDVEATAADIEKALHVNLRVYQHPNEPRTFYAPDADPSVDLNLPVAGIKGLDSFSRPQPRFSATLLSQAANAAPCTGSGPIGTYMGNDFRAAYIPGSPLTGAGQTVGLVQFDGYYTNDIATYVRRAGLPSVTLSNVLLDGFNGVPSGMGGEVEVALDIEMAISMAPGLDKVIVYQAGPYGNWYDILNRIATDNLARQIGCSWYEPGGPADPVTDAIFQQMAAQGQSFFSASGDYGAFAGPIDFPDDTPYITLVGGTTLSTTGPGGERVSETVWNWNNGYASGGGISTSYAIPSWQARVDMSANHGSTMMRNTPDVALTADNIYVVANGLDYVVAGTSCAAPLWAGFTALINQQAAANGRLSVGFLNPSIYALGLEPCYTMGMHDTTTGSNVTPYTPPNMFLAAPGYDLCTGWGTPNGTNLINALVPAADTLQVSPGLGFVASGPPEGPFEPPLETFSLKNTGTGPLNWAAASTAPWLQLSGTHGQLKPGEPPGTVTVSVNPAMGLPIGSHTATAWFTNLNNGFVQSREFRLQLVNLPAVITKQPVDRATIAGSAATFTVSATGTHLHYRWARNGGSLIDGANISGASTSTLVLSNISGADAGFYSVTVSNSLGSVTSSNAVLKVFLPGGGLLVQNGGFETGDFTGWSSSGNAEHTSVTTDHSAIHTGAHGALLGPVGSLGFLSQALPTVPGAPYVVSVWLDSPDGQSPNEFQVAWNGRATAAGLEAAPVTRRTNEPWAASCSACSAWSSPTPSCRGVTAATRARG